MPGLHADLQGRIHPDVGPVAPFEAARLNLADCSLPDRVSHQRHNCAERQPPGAGLSEARDGLRSGTVHVDRDAADVEHVPGHAHPLHEVSTPCGSEQGGNTRFPQ